MRRIFTLIIFYCLISSYNLYADIIAQQDFETTPATPEITYSATTSAGSPGSNTGISTGNTALGDAPASLPLYAGGSRGYRMQGPNSGSATTSHRLTFASTNTSSYSNINASFRVAPMSIGSNGNGIDNTIDECLIEVSTDGMTWYQQAKVNTSGSNTRWAFSATGSGSRAYLANNLFTNFTVVGSGTVTGATGITTVTITDLPAVSSLYLRITMTSNTANESWIIDNVIITGDVTTPTISASPNITGLNYYWGAGPSTAQSFSLSAAFLDPKDDTIYVYAPTNFKIATSSGGTYVDTLKFAYTDSTLASTTVWTRLVAGLSINSYADSIVISGGTAPIKKIGVSGSVIEATITPSTTSITGLNYVLGLGASKPQLLTVSANNLTPASGNLTVTAPTNFLISSSETGTYSSSITIPYTSGGLISAGNVFVVLQSGLSVANYADSISISGGGATLKKVGLAGSVAIHDCNELYISEYIVGTGNNKFIEIYNPTANTINLCTGSVNYYSLQVFIGGSSTPTNIGFTSGASIAPYSTYIIRNGSSTIYSGTSQTSGSISFTGDDAVSLQKHVTPATSLTATSLSVDIIGRIGEDPGTAWTFGTISSNGQTLVRNPSVIKGITTNPISGFPTLGTEWIAYPINESHTLGSHVNICQTPNITYVDNLSVTTICPGETMTVDFNSLGTFTAGNIFTAQLSNSSGFFTTSTNIGSLSLFGTNPNGTINVTIPSGATASSNYHIRVVSNNPISGSLISQQELIVNSTIPPVVTSPSATQEDNATTLSWTNPSTGCWEQTMVVISTNPSFTFTPTGNGSAYIANSIYSSGTQVVFKDIGDLVNITGLTNGTIYYVKIFTRNGSNWSVAVNYEFLVDPYCHPKYTGTCDEYISNVTLNTINNSTLEGCGLNGYNWYADQSTTLVKGEKYVITVQVGIVGRDDVSSYGGDNLRVWVDWNGNGAFVNTGFERIVTDNIGGAAGSYTFQVPNTAVTGNTRMRVQLLRSNKNSYQPCGSFVFGETEDYTLNIIQACTPLTSTFKFYPEKGSAGTEIRINKTSGSSGGFLSVDSVKFNGKLSPSFKVVDDNTMFAIVPENAETGVVTLYDNSSCYRYSSSDFIYLSNEGSCNLYSDLFISEVFDPSAGNIHYLEVFNGTGKTVNLNSSDNYSLRVFNKSNIADSITCIVHNVNIIGTIPTGQNRIYYAGQTGPLVTGSQSLPGVGYNADDDILLINNGVTVDKFETPGTNFDKRRKNTVTGPSASYSSIDWTTNSGTSDLGTYIPLNPPFTITTHPSDVSGCKIDLTTTATGSGLSYQWYYNDNLTNDIVWKVADSLEILFPLCVVTGAATNHLVVTGDLSQFENYQFYCKVTETTCSEFSNVARFKILPDPYFRSKQSGDWRLASTWQTSPTGTGSWIDACTFPWDTNSLSVVIRNGHQILISEISANTPDVRIDQLKILSGGELKIENTAELHVNNGVGTDLFIQGTLYDQGSSSGNNGVSFLDTAKWVFDVDGILIKSGNSSVISYKDHYQDGISTIPATAHWIYRKETTVLPSIVTNGMYYPNLYFEDTYLGGASYVLTGNTDYMTVKGSLFVGDTALNVIVSNNNNFTTPMRVLGNVKIGAGSIYRISASPIGTGIEIAGNITNEGTFDVNHLSTGLLRLNGSLDQTISGKGVFDIWNMELDKVAQTQVILDTNIDVKNQLKFIGGIVNTKANILTVSNGDPSIAIIGFDAPNGTGIYSNDNYVIGKLRRSIGLANNIYIFPIGDTVSKMGYNPSSLTIRAIPGSSPYAIGEFIPQWPGTINTYRVINYCGGLNFIEYRGFACNSYWKYEGSIFSNYDIYIHPNVSNPNVRPNEETNLGHTKTYRALKEVSFQAGLTWNPDASEYGNACIVSNNFYSIIGSGYTGFSIFSPGGGNGNTTALPVQLLNFDVECISDIPSLKWATASELNSDYFTLEKSSDGSQFNPIANINAAGNSNQKIEYTYTIPSSEIDNYYRLVETDFDGSKYYHGIRSLDCKTTYNNSYVYYQPNQGITVQFNTNQMPISIEVFDASGRLMSKEIINKNLNKHFVSSSTNWAKGVYFVRMLYGNNEIKSEKVAIY